MSDYMEDYLDIVNVLPRHAPQFGSRHPLGDPALARAFLDQGEAWCDRFASYLRIVDMDPGHAIAAANFVLARGQSVALVVLAAGDSSASSSVVSDYGARNWLLGTTLVKALVERGRGGVPAPLPWVKSLSRKPNRPSVRQRSDGSFR